MGAILSTGARRREAPRSDDCQLVELPKPNWERNGNCIWTSVNGTQVRLTDVELNNLTRLEISALQEIAYEEIQTLNVEKTIADDVKHVFQKLRFPSKKPINNNGSKSNIFGKPLEIAFAQDKEEYVKITDQEIPLFVYVCIEYLEKHALHAVGLFRIGSSCRRLKEMRAMIEKDCMSTIEMARSPHDVAALFREYFRDLPEPLICQNLYLAFIKTQKIADQELKLKVLTYLIYFLPPIHANTLSVLLKFLSKVASFSEDIYDADGSIHFYGNKMDSKNLAMIFAPNILRNGSAYKEESKKETVNDVIEVMTILIDNHETLFCVTAEQLDKIYAYMVRPHPEELNLLFLCRKMESNKGAEELSDTIEPIKWAKPRKARKRFMLQTKTITTSDGSTQTTPTPESLNFQEVKFSFQTKKYVEDASSSPSQDDSPLPKSSEVSRDSTAEDALSLENDVPIITSY